MTAVVYRYVLPVLLFIVDNEKNAQSYPWIMWTGSSFNPVMERRPADYLYYQ